jgi:arylsulfatase A-like enzyme
MKQYETADLPKASVGAWAKRFEPKSDESFNIWHGDEGEEQVRRSRQGYYGSVSFVDEQIGRILETLEKRGMLEETLIVYTSDHGDMTGDHHLWRKTYGYEASARIPMIVRSPKGFATDAQRGRTILNPVELRDLLPTFLDAAEDRKDRQLDGRSLLPLVRGAKIDWREYIDLEHSAAYNGQESWTGLTDGRSKYLYHARSGEEQFFDLAKDPNECTDLSGEAAAAPRLRAWRNRMIAHLEPRGDAWVKGGKLQLRAKPTVHSPAFSKG